MPTVTNRSARSPRKTPKQWRAIIDRFEQSDLTIKNFCHKENLAQGTFSKWRSRFREESSQPGFIELQSPTDSALTAELWSVQMDLPGGGHLHIRVGL